MRNLREKHTRTKFTPDEDEKLRQLAMVYGGKKWQLIAEQMPGRNARQCRDRYSNYLVPGFFNGQWSPREDEILLQQYRIHGPRWSKIMKFLEGRSANAIKNRWNYFMVKQVNLESVSPSTYAPERPNEVEQNKDVFGDFLGTEDGNDFLAEYDMSDLFSSC